MIVGCPNCNRKYKLGQEYSGKFIQCLCKNVLKVPESSSFMPGFGSSGTPSNEEEEAFWSDLLLPSPTALFDFDRYGPVEDQKEEPEKSLDMPALHEDMPSFEEDDMGFEDMEYELPDLGDDEEDEITEEQQSALEGLQVQEKTPLDPRLPRAVEELKESTEPRFIVELLYYLLEVKSLSIEDGVKAQVGNKNPLSDYFASRILRDLSKLKGKNPQPMEEFPRKDIFSELFFGGTQSKISLVEKALEQRWFAAVPYFMVQLMREKDVDVLCEFLSRLGLLATPLESCFFGKFIRHTNRRVRLAAIEGLSGIGGPTILPALVNGLGETDPDTAEAVKTALRGADKVALAKEIRSFLAKNKVPDKTGYIAVLKENSNPESFRTLVWLLDDASIRSYALAAIRDLPIEDDLKIPHLEEFLLLTNDDTTFCHEIVELMEVIQPSFDATRLVPITVFDDSYIGQVRFSPLFAKDFEEKTIKKDESAEDEYPDLEDFDIAEEGRKISNEIKELANRLKFLGKSTYFQPYFLFYTLILIPTIALTTISFFKGMGSAPMTQLPLDLLPKRFITNFSKSIFTDPDFSSSITLLITVLGVNLILGWFLGSSLATGQLKSTKLKPRLLPTLPLLLSPVLMGYALPSILTSMKIEMVIPAIFFMYLFPAISIFYLVYLRMFTIYPEGHLHAARSLGADLTRAYATTYGPVYHVGTAVGAVLFSIYLFGSVQLTAFLQSKHSLGYVLLAKTRYYEGWLMVGAYGASLALFILIALVLIEAFIPLVSLFPAGTRPDSKEHPIAARWPRWMSLLGWLFYSRAYQKKGIVKKEAEPVLEVVAEPTVAKPDDEAAES